VRVILSRCCVRVCSLADPNVYRQLRPHSEKGVSAAVSCPALPKGSKKPSRRCQEKNAQNGHPPQHHPAHTPNTIRPVDADDHMWQQALLNKPQNPE